MRALSNVRALKGSERKRVPQPVEATAPELALSAPARELWVAIHFPVSPPRSSLEKFAAQAQRFTPRISLVPPDSVLLEIKGSLNLFGGAQALYVSIVNECIAQGLKAKVALAPTPLAALGGARAGRSFVLTDTTQLISHVSSLPLSTLRWPDEVLERLKKIGVRTVGHALRLPRKGFARRFGVAQLNCLDQLTGRQADLRRNFQTPERFSIRCDFEYELTHHEAILAAMQPLLTKLGEFLQARQNGVMRLDCWLRHRQAPPSRCTVQFAAPAANPHHIAQLLGERLAALKLPEPVRACVLKSGRLLSRPQVSESLWSAGEQGSEGANLRSAALIERLSARLGPEAISHVSVIPGHRPEKAWRLMSPAMPGSRSSLLVPWTAFQRPLWLVDPPELLPEVSGLPLRTSPLQLASGPERLESGWWDDDSVARDYYTAIDAGGAKLWIFRERQAPHRWYLHGIFG